MTVCSEEENSSVEVGGEAADEENLCDSVMVFPRNVGTCSRTREPADSSA